MNDTNQESLKQKLASGNLHSKESFLGDFIVDMTSSLTINQQFELYQQEKILQDKTEYAVHVQNPVISKHGV